MYSYQSRILSWRKFFFFKDVPNNTFLQVPTLHIWPDLIERAHVLIRYICQFLKCMNHILIDLSHILRYTGHLPKYLPDVVKKGIIESVNVFENLSANQGFTWARLDFLVNESDVLLESFLIILPIVMSFLLRYWFGKQPAFEKLCMRHWILPVFDIYKFWLCFP